MTDLKPLALAGLMLAVPAFGLADITAGDTIAVSEAEIRSQLESEGYTVHEIEYENGEIEVEVYKDGVETELVLAASDGTVLKVEIEEDD